MQNIGTPNQLTVVTSDTRDTISKTLIFISVKGDFLKLYYISTLLNVTC